MLNIIKKIKNNLDSTNLVIIQGLFGSFIIFLGSIGNGWIANASFLMQNQLIIYVRTKPICIILSIIFLSSGSILLFKSWINFKLVVFTKYYNKSVNLIILKTIFIWSIPLMFSLPIFSRDVYAYIGQGRLVVEGLDPYTKGISSLANWFALGADPNWAQNATPYGPLFLLIEKWIIQIGNEIPEIYILLFRITSFIGVLLCILYIPKLALLQGINPQYALWISVLNPLFLISFIASAHNDSLMLGFSLMSIYMAQKKHILRSIIALSMSIAIKPITIIFLPFIALFKVGNRSHYFIKIFYMLTVTCASLIILDIIGEIGNFKFFGWIPVILNTGDGWMIYSPIGFLSFIVENIFNFFNFNGLFLSKIIRKTGTILSILIFILTIMIGKYKSLMKRATIAISSIVLLSPVIQPWYILWILPFLTTTFDVRKKWITNTVYILILYFIILGAQDQLSIFSFINIYINPKKFSIFISLMHLFYIFILHKNKKIITNKF